MAVSLPDAGRPVPAPTPPPNSPRPPAVPARVAAVPDPASTVPARPVSAATAPAASALPLLASAVWPASSPLGSNAGHAAPLAGPAPVPTPDAVGPARTGPARRWHLGAGRSRHSLLEPSGPDRASRPAP